MSEDLPIEESGLPPADARWSAPPRRKRKLLHRPVPRKVLYPDLEVEEILAWADAYHLRAGRWPNINSGPVTESPREKWKTIDKALREGRRGLPRGSSLARLLVERRGIRHRAYLPALTEEQILAWADSHHERTGEWPSQYSEAVPGAPDETWCGINNALRTGGRGLPGGCTILLLLVQRRGVRCAPPLSEEEVLRWADAHFARAGCWPHRGSGPVIDASRESWGALDGALKQGARNLPGGMTLALLLGTQRGVRNKASTPRLAEGQILAWVDAHRDRTGEWPTTKSGPIPEAPGETWMLVDSALHQAARGLPGGSSLARLLARHRGRRNPKGLPPLSEDQILAWADRHRERTGSWPSVRSGEIPEAPGVSWARVEAALSRGGRGLPGDSSLRRLLAQRRQARNRRDLPSLTVEQILAWADTHHARIGGWPNAKSGAILEAPGDTWSGVQHAFHRGSRGLPKGATIAGLLAEHRGVRNVQGLPPLIINGILSWADAHRQRTGSWPTSGSGPVQAAPGEDWSAINAALRTGGRGLPGGSSLALLIATQRGVRNRRGLPRLSEEPILAWADAHHARTGKWPVAASGAIHEAPEETWAAVHAALSHGGRGLAGGSSLPRLLAARRGMRNRKALPRLTEEQILIWADQFHEQTGRWPNPNSGPVRGSEGETWSGIQGALTHGVRGLPGGTSLARLLAERRGRRNPKSLPPLTFAAILTWAENHHARTGAWPMLRSGPIPEGAGETWGSVNQALVRGTRGLPGGWSLSRLLKQRGGPGTGQHG